PGRAALPVALAGRAGALRLEAAAWPVFFADRAPPRGEPAFLLPWALPLDRAAGRAGALEVFFFFFADIRCFVGGATSDVQPDDQEAAETRLDGRLCQRLPHLGCRKLVGGPPTRQASCGTGVLLFRARGSQNPGRLAGVRDPEPARQVEGGSWKTSKFSQQIPVTTNENSRRTARCAAAAGRGRSTPRSRPRSPARCARTAPTAGRLR